MNSKTAFRALTGLSTALLLGACASEPTLTETTFGDSVRQMIAAQTYDPGTLSAPPEGAIESTDGRMLEGAIETYRQSSTQPQSVGDAITISLGQ